MRVYLVTAGLLLMYAVFVGSQSYVFPPPSASWERYAGNPIISPTEAWEETATSEVVCLYRPGATTFDIWYTGGWDNPGVGYATSSLATPYAVTKYASNPVLGQGGSGLAGGVASTWVYLDGSTYHLFGSGGSPIRSTMIHYTSSDRTSWTSASLTITIPGANTLWGNRTVWKEGSTYYMLQEAGPSVWQIYLYTSSDLNTWSIQNSGNPLTTLQIAVGGMYGGPRVAEVDGVVTPKVDSIYHLWYHAANVSGVLPTDIYHATSTDRITWVPNGPVLTHLGSGYEADQAAGPCILQVGGDSFMFYDGDDNTAESAAIGLATYP